ncbi:MAG: heavy metal-responsive transcriptional regulator, partial [Mariprofundaceae bacterium]|nr:heavy metal-responsive transcriptional regulator [Mariprofundaceae bacterium]
MKIGELAKQAKIKVDTIRYYEQRQLMPLPKRTYSGYRDYSKNDLKRLLFIVHAKKMGFTLKEIGELLHLQTSKNNCSKTKKIALQKSSDIAIRIESLSRIKAILDELAEKCDEEGEDECP